MNDILQEAAAEVAEIEAAASDAVDAANEAADAAQIASRAADDAIETANRLASVEAAQLIASHVDRVAALETGLEECRSMLQAQQETITLILSQASSSSTPPEETVVIVEEIPQPETEVVTETTDPAEGEAAPEDRPTPAEVRRHRIRRL